MNKKRVLYHVSVFLCLLAISLWALVPAVIFGLLEWEDGLGRMGKIWFSHNYRLQVAQEIKEYCKSGKLPVELEP